MAYTIPKAAVIPYPPQKLHEFKLIWFEYVDNLHFGLNPAGFVDNPEPYLDIARQRFLEAGWAGDGEISLMWIPPFAINDIDGTRHMWTHTHGVVVWHVKQQSDGISWILYPPEEIDLNEYTPRDEREAVPDGGFGRPEAVSGRPESFGKRQIFIPLKVPPASLR